MQTVWHLASTLLFVARTGAQNFVSLSLLHRVKQSKTLPRNIERKSGMRPGRTQKKKREKKISEKKAPEMKQFIRQAAAISLLLSSTVARRSWHAILSAPQRERVCASHSQHRVSAKQRIVDLYIFQLHNSSLFGSVLIGGWMDGRCLLLCERWTRAYFVYSLNHLVWTIGSAGCKWLMDLRCEFNLFGIHWPFRSVAKSHQIEGKAFHGSHCYYRTNCTLCTHTHTNWMYNNKFHFRPNQVALRRRHTCSAIRVRFFGCIFRFQVDLVLNFYCNDIASIMCACVARRSMWWLRSNVNICSNASAHKHTGFDFIWLAFISLPHTHTHTRARANLAITCRERRTTIEPAKPNHQTASLALYYSLLFM